MNNKEILEFMLDNFIDLLFKYVDNKISFLEFMYTQNVLSEKSFIKSALDRHHISFYCVDGDRSETCVYGNSSNGVKKEYYYEDLFSSYKVELL